MKDVTVRMTEAYGWTAREVSPGAPNQSAVLTVEDNGTRWISQVNVDRLALSELADLVDFCKSYPVENGYIFRGGYIEDPAGDRWWSADLLKRVETERDALRHEVESLREQVNNQGHGLLRNEPCAGEPMDENEEKDLRDELARVKRELSQATRDFIAAKEDLHAMTEKAERLEQVLEVIAQDNEGWTAKYAKQVLVDLIKGTMRSRTREWPGTENEK